MKKALINIAVLAAAFAPCTVFAAEEGDASVGARSASSLIMIVALFAIMYFIMIRPQQKKEKETQNMRNSLKVGDEIVTIGGIYGKIVKIREDRITIAVLPSMTKMEFSKWAISGLADQNADTAARANKKEKTKEEPEEENKKPSPKSIKRLGAKAEETAEEAVEAVEVIEAVEEVIEDTADEVTASKE